MNIEMLIALINNAALLLSLGVMYDVLFFDMHMNTRLRSTVAGIIIGLIGIALMLNPWELSPGIIFDTRSILLSIVGLFFGFTPAVIGAIIVGSYRLYEGGAGAVAGIAVTMSSVILGLLWRQFHESFKKLFSMFELYIFGIVIHIVMLMYMLLLPWQVGMEVLNHISFPVMLIYPIGTVLLGTLLNNQLFRKRTQDALKENEAKLQNFIDNVPVGMFRTSSEGKNIQINPEMSRIVGLSKTEQIARHFQDIGEQLYIEPACSKEVVNILKEQGYVENFECEALRPDGKELCLLINAIASGELEEGAFMIDGFALDITERKKAEEHMLLAKITAEDANRFKSELLSNMNHELRTPLNSIMGFSAIMLDGTSGEITGEQKKYLQIINKNGHSLLSLVDNVLDLSKIESGSLEFKPEILDIMETIEQIKRKVYFLSSRKNISINISGDSHIPQICADANKFKEIIYKLVENSLKFTQEGGMVTIKVTQKNGNIEVSVIDNGIGIADYDIEKIFEPFVQVDGSSTRRYGGAGLGLTLVKEYVQMHNGTIRIESEPGKGSNFRVMLPINRDVCDD
ncbi:ATP-binding protein [Methanolobus sp. ZRKC5]|uniref:ATP-binding protein n=1 Tax=unclassified Methanolobus TaxID=2629569 RepID=UPI00313D841A